VGARNRGEVVLEAASLENPHVHKVRSHLEEQRWRSHGTV